MRILFTHNLAGFGRRANVINKYFTSCYVLFRYISDMLLRVLCDFFVYCIPFFDFKKVKIKSMFELVYNVLCKIFNCQTHS